MFFYPLAVKRLSFKAEPPLLTEEGGNQVAFGWIMDVCVVPLPGCLSVHILTDSRDVKKSVLCECVYVCVLLLLLDAVLT